MIWPRFALMAALALAMFGWPHLWRWLRNTPKQDRNKSGTDG